jgi:hypothetical protein
MSGGNVGLVVLGIALEAQEIIIAAARHAGIFAAHRGPCLVDRAAPLLDIEELADPAVVFVLLASHDALIAVSGLQIFLLEGLEREAEILRQPDDIALRDDDRGIGTAVAGALQAIVVLAHYLGHRPPLTVQAINRTAAGREQ